jgi:poly(A) polymerase
MSRIDTDKDTVDLVNYLKENKIFNQTPSNSEFRQTIIDTLQSVANDWSGEIENGVQLHPYGSYRLGVDNDKSDIDILVIGARHLTRESFFKDFKSRLESHAYVNKLQAIPEAFIPVIKIVIAGIDVDLSFLHVNIEHLPQIDFNDSIFFSLVCSSGDAKNIMSLNGPRVADAILKLVPNPAIFSVSLRFIKFWAERRAIYSNIFGYLGGISWAICVAFVCQLFPTANASMIIKKFFSVMISWSWPTALRLQKTETEHATATATVDDIKVWSASHYDIMPILTPCNPCMNTTHNVSLPTFNVIKRELIRAKEIVATSASTSASTSQWTLLCEPNIFFYEYKTYLVIEVAANTQDDFQKWHGWVQSKIRHFVMRIDNPGIEAHLLSNGVTSTLNKKMYFIGLKFNLNLVKDVDENGNKCVNLGKSQSYFQTIISGTFDRKEGMSATIECLKGKEVRAKIGLEESKKKRLNFYK